MPILAIHSSKRTSGTPDDFVCSLTHSIDGLWRLVYASVPNCSHTASGSLTVAVGGGGSTTVAITAGFHTATSLASEVQTQLQAIDASFACSFDAVAGKLVVTHASSSFTCAFDDTLAKAVGTGGSSAVVGSTDTLTSDVLDLAHAVPAFLLHVGDHSPVATVDNHMSSLIIPNTSDSTLTHSVFTADMFEQHVHFRHGTRRVSVRVTDESNQPLSDLTEWLLILQKISKTLRTHT